MENRGEEKDLAQMNVHRDGERWVRFAKCFYMKGGIYQEGINWREYARAGSELHKAEAGEGEMEDGDNMAGI